MVKLEKNGPDATIQAKGHFVEVSSDVIFLVDEFYSRLKRTRKWQKSSGPGHGMGERKFR